jgi:flagellar biosynthesis/type III secretory pathway chaperone
MSAVASELQQLFAQQRGSCEQLQTQARQITELLRDGEFDALQTALLEERSALEMLAQTGRQLGEVLARHGYPGGREGLRDCLAAHDGDGRLREQWQQLREQLTRCRELNRGNGILARQGQRHTQATLALLTGANRRETPTYDSHGSASQLGGSRDLGAA